MDKDGIEIVEPIQDEIEAIEQAKKDIQNGDVFNLASLNLLILFILFLSQHKNMGYISVPHMQAHGFAP